MTEVAERQGAQSGFSFASQGAVKAWEGRGSGGPHWGWLQSARGSALHEPGSQARGVAPPHPSEYLIFHMLSSFDEILLKVNVLQVDPFTPH